MIKEYCDNCRKEIKINLNQHHINSIFASFRDNNGKYSTVEYMYCKNCYKNAKKNVMAALTRVNY